jgi:hypothetical protein
MWYTPFKFKIHQVYKAFRKFIHRDNEFTRRINRRHKIFWSDPNAEDIRNTVLSMKDSIEKWQDDMYWQRKLSNKYNAKLFSMKMDCKVADLYWKGEDPALIDFENLPAQYVIRPTIGHS